MNIATCTEVEVLTLARVYGKESKGRVLQVLGKTAKFSRKPRRWQTALELFSSFQQRRLELSQVSHNTIIDTCASLRWKVRSPAFNLVLRFGCRSL